MNEAEAKSMLSLELSRYRERSYTQLYSLIDRSERFERISPSGAIYQIEVQVFLDDKEQRTLRVKGSVDDGSWRAFKPLRNDFIMAQDGFRYR